MRISVFGLVVVFTVLSASAEAQDADNRLTLDLYLEYESVSDPRLSPDGQQVIYSRQWIDKVNDRRESSLWIMDTDGSRNRFLVEGSSRSMTRGAFVHVAPSGASGMSIGHVFGSWTVIVNAIKSPSGAQDKLPGPRSTRVI